MTATPHNGKEEDFQLFMALLDGDRFAGRFRDGVHIVDTSDLMRRLVKEQLLKFDGRPRFPERRAYTVTYDLSDAEAALYKEVTDYVREEFNRADALENDKRKGNVGFALTILQRRLASSPEAIYQSLRRRRERLEKRLREEKLEQRGAEVLSTPEGLLDLASEEDWADLEELPEAELEAAEERIVDRATASETIAELKAEIAILKGLEQRAHAVRMSGTDRKWEELSALLQNQSEMFDAHGHRRKLVIFTEHRDTLRYLTERIGSLLGRPDAVVNIQGGMGREERRKAQAAFTQDKTVEILVATDAAGEGFDLIYGECIRQSKPLPDFARTDDHFVWLTLHGTIQDPAFLRFLEQVGREKQALFDLEDLLVLDLVHREQTIPAGLKPRLLRFRELGVVEAIGRGRGTRYLLSRRFYGSVGRPGAYTRRRGLDRDANRALLLKHIRENARRGSNLEELQQVLPGLSRRQVQTLVQDLKKTGLVRKVGEVRWARWFPCGGSDDEENEH